VVRAGDSPPGPGLGVEISCRVYKPRRPRDSPLFQLVERHLEELLRVWPTRFARQRGPLRPVVERVLQEFLREAEKPPPPRREMLRVAEHGDGWGVPQEWD
jgi:hypothetical protein